MSIKSAIYIGTSGWHYKHWKGTFYPEDIKEKDQLAQYIQTFHTVELNNSFYHLPLRNTFKQWKKSVPENFIFAVKGSRYITHMKKLKESSEAIHAFLHNASGLKEKLGPILFQLPPGWKINTQRLEDFLKQLPEHFRFAFEFRNTSWYTEEVYTLLRKYNCAFCIYELDRHTSPMEVTTDFVYVRLHGPAGKYQGSYSKRQLNSWAKKCINWQQNHKNVFIYFDNDQEGYAAFNAQTLQQLLDKKTH
ncbi:MAG: DUF72 domain-containing protein [Cytophaga sp.]|uniref:DUF72 domain-containing protein n=1 Tax=Cytophaga sp. TaxID=29535 RepID=UPI003F81A2DD